MNTNEEINEEKREIGNISRATVKEYLKAGNYGIFSAFLIATIISKGTCLVIDFWLKEFISKDEVHFEFLEKIGDFFSVFFVLTAIYVLGEILMSVLSSMSSLWASKNIFEKLNHAIIYSKIDFFEMNSVGRIINRVSNDLLSIDLWIWYNMRYFLEYIIICISTPVVIIIQIPYMGIGKKKIIFWIIK